MSFRSKYSKLAFLLLAGSVCLLAWAIMVHHLDFNSMWDDEHYTWRISREGPFYLIPETGLDVHPPAHYLWVWVWRTWMGGSDNLFILRLSSAITSLLTVAVSYRLGIDWFRSRWVGLGAALFIATSGIFVFYARELRMYSLITLLAAISWFMLKRLVNRRRGSVWGYAAALALMAYTFYSAAFIVITQLVVIVVFYRRHLRRVLLAFVIALIAFLPWLPTFIHQTGVTKAQRGVEDVLIVGPLATKPTSLETFETFVNIYTAFRPTFILLLLVLVLTTVFDRKYPLRYQRWAITAAVWLVLTLGLFLGVNLVVPVYGLRYVITILPALALLVGVAVNQMPHFWPRIGLIAIILLSGLITHDQVFDEILVIAPHREMLKTIAAHFQPGDKIWYNLSYGARGSSLGLSADYHLEYDVPVLTSDDFVWDAPYDYADTTLVPRVWDVRPYWIPVLDDAVLPLTSGRYITEEYEIRGYSVRLYEAPPDDLPVYSFGDQFEVMIGEESPLVCVSDKAIRVTTWWRLVQTPTLDYSFGLYLYRGEEFITQTDDRLVLQGQPTSRWGTAETFTPVILSLELPQHVNDGDYELMLGVYYWEDETRLPITGDQQQQIDAERVLLRVAAIHIEKNACVS